jgi:integrase
MTVAFTDAWLRGINGKPYSGKPDISYRSGVGIRISPKGMITWVLRTVVNGKPIKMKIGTYPDMKITTAIQEATKLQELAKKGIDPRSGIKKNDEVITINYIIDYWVKHHASRNLKRYDTLEKMFRRHIAKKLGNCAVTELELKDFLEVFGEAREKVSEKYSANLMSRFKSVLSFAVRHGMIKFNPLSELLKSDVGQPVTPKKQKQNVDGVRPLWNGIGQLKIHESNKNFLRLNMIFACRPNELRLAKKRDFDLVNMVWTVPEENNKTRKKDGGAIKRAIPPLACGVIRDQFQLFPAFKVMFPAVLVREDRVMSANTPVDFGAKLADYIKSKGYPRTTNHDMRRTARNIWERMGIKYHVSETMLGHKVHTGVQSHYLDYDYLDEQREAYDKWCAVILKGCLD